MTTALAKVLTGLLIAATGCSDYTLVEPTEAPGSEAETLFGAALRVERSASSRYELRALLFRGTDAGGRLNEFVDGALYVEGEPLQPRVQLNSELWGYDWEETRTDGGLHADSVQIRLPVRAASVPPGVAVTIPIPGREDPEQITWVEGQDLRLHTSPAAVASPQFFAAISDWTLELGDECVGVNAGRALRVTGRGAHPTEFRIPWEWLSSGSPPPSVACLRVLASYRVANAPYRADVSVDLRVVWRISVSAAASTVNK